MTTMNRQSLYELDMRGDTEMYRLLHRPWVRSSSPRLGSSPLLPKVLHPWEDSLASQTNCMDGSVPNMIHGNPMCTAMINFLYSMRCLQTSVFLSLVTLLFIGCGGGETPEVKEVAMQPPAVTPTSTAVILPPVPTATPQPSPTPTDTLPPPTTTPVPVPPTPTLTPTKVEMVEVDIASLQRFPDLRYIFSGTLPDQGSPEAALMDGAPLVEGATQTGLWAASLPASFEVIVPPLGDAFLMNRVEVTDPGGDKSLHKFEVYIQTPGNPEWQRPPGMMGLRMQQGPGMKGEEGKTVCAFTRVKASAVRIEFPKGDGETPDHVFITDIDVIGTAPKGSLPLE